MYERQEWYGSAARPSDAPSQPTAALLFDAVATGAIGALDATHAVAESRRYGGPPLDVLRSTGRISDACRSALLANHHDLALIDLERRRPSPHLVTGLRAEDCLRLGFVPWQKIGRTLILAVADPDDFDDISAVMRTRHRVVFALATRPQIEQAVVDLFEAQMAERALTLCPDTVSCRNWRPARFALRAMALLLLLMTAILMMPAAVITVLMVWILLANTLTMGLRLVSLALLPRARRAERLATLGHQLPRHFPIVTILLPVLRETAVLEQLVRAMRRLNYPAHRLDLLLLVEESDVEMRRALMAMTLPHNMRVLVVPDSHLKTKPRAMNYALPFCRGSIIGIYDAEDRPEPDQIRRVVAHLHTRSDRVACVQAHLDFYNPYQNWLTRCFTLEYATWFRVLLHGTQALRFPLPLGGTSVFFRAHILRRVGGWDAHNVTEDADLGMRLARYGFRCEMVRSTTFEEANPAIGNWLRQRSRWLKGYAITWATHMRSPSRLWRDLGPRGFLGFQVLFLGALTAYLSIPVLWGILGASLLGIHLPANIVVPAPLYTALWISLPLGQGIMLLTVVQALRSRGDLGLSPWVLTLPLYWPLGAMAAWRAMAELNFAPFHWHKTRHGLSDEAQDATR